MTRYTSKTNPDIVVDIGDDDVLPGGPDAWTEAGGKTRRRRNTDTGSTPVQRNNNE